MTAVFSVTTCCQAAMSPSLGTHHGCAEVRVNLFSEVSKASDIKNSASVQRCRIEFCRQRFGWSRKEQLYCFARQRQQARGTERVHASQMVFFHQGGFDVEFYSNDSRVGSLIILGCVQALLIWFQAVFFFN